MTYVKNTWQKGDTITSSKLNKMEKGIEEATSIQGEKGDIGTRGSRLWTSTNVTGNSSEGTVFANSGISGALVYDYCINRNTSNVYVCSKGGNADVAEWKYDCNIKGEQGIIGATGSTGEQGVKGESGIGIKTIVGSMGGDSGKDLTLNITLTDESVQNVTVTLPIA